MPAHTNRPVYGPEPTQAMVRHKRSLAAEPKWPQVVAPQKSLWDGFLDTMSGVGSSIKQAENRWNRATTVPIPPKFVGGTPENQAARERFSQQASNAASGLVNLPQKAKSLLPIGEPAAVTARPVAPNPPAVTGSNLPDPFAEAVAQSGIVPARPSAPPSLTPVSLRRRANADLSLPLQRISPPSQPAQQTPDDLVALLGLPPEAAPATPAETTPFAPIQPGQDPAAVLAARNRHIAEHGVSPETQTIVDQIMAQAQQDFGKTDYGRQAAMRNVMRGEEARRQAAAEDVNATVDEAIARLQRQPRVSSLVDMNQWLEGPLALQAGQARQQAAQRQAQEAQNQLAAETIQATARPGSGGQAFGTHGGTAPRHVFERRGSPSDYLDYMTQAIASRDAAREGDVVGAAGWPGAWQGWVSPNDRRPNPDGSMAAGPGRSTIEMLSPEQREGIRDRRAARAEGQAIRQQMVTARAQGRRMSPDEAAIAYLMGENRPLSEDQRARAFGQPYLEAEAQKAVADRTATAQERAAEIAAQTNRMKYDPMTMMMAGLGGALANLPEAATPDLISNIIGGVMDMAGQMGVQLPGQGGGQPAAPVEPGQEASPIMATFDQFGLGRQQREEINRLMSMGSEGAVPLRNYLMNNTNLPPEEINRLLQQATNREDAHIGAPTGEWMPMVNSWLRYFGLMDDPFAGRTERFGR